MTEVKSAARRGHGEDGIYFDASKSRYVGAVSLGYGADGRRIRRKVVGRTKAEVRDKLKALHREMDSHVQRAERRHIRHVPALAWPAWRVRPPTGSDHDNLRQ